MNYIAHIHQAHLTQSSLLGNFLGDFVKGTDLSTFTEDIQFGITLHRRIDTFTDNHSLIKQLRPLYPKSIRRMAGVITDIYFDHLLCRNFSQYSSTSLSALLEQFYDEVMHTNIDLQGRYFVVKQGLMKYKWLQEYEQEEACIRAFYQIEKRLNNKIEFAERGAKFLETYAEPLQTCFFEFYPQLTTYTLQQVAYMRATGAKSP